MQPKGHHEMCISEELPEEGMNSWPWGGKVCLRRDHVMLELLLARTQGLGVTDWGA